MSDFNRISSSLLADYILSKLENVSHLKLQKLLYYVDAWHLAVLDEALVNEDFEAWLHGPVVRSVYARFKAQGGFMYDSIYIDPQQKAAAIQNIEAGLHRDQMELISDVLSEYGDKSDYHLECLTHSEEPWIEARKGVEAGEASQNRLSKETMKRYYAQLLAD